MFQPMVMALGSWAHRVSETPPGNNPNTVFVTFNQVSEQSGILEDNPWHKPVISSAFWKVKVILLRDILESSLRVNFSSDCSSFKIKVKIFFYFMKNAFEL